MAYADVQNYMNAAQAALALGDFVTARNQAYAAQGALAILPDVTRDVGGGGSQGTTFSRESIQAFIENMNRQANAQAGVQHSRVVIHGLRGYGVNQGGVY